MNTFLCFTVRFLDPAPRFHGRGADGDCEWPPSPLRLFQTLVCAAATRWRENEFRECVQPALQWLETIQPTVVSPSVPAPTSGYRMYVPNNSGDLMTAAWARGDTEVSMAKFRVEKDVRPTCLGGEAVCYLFPLIDGCPHFDILRSVARSITHLGWGIDMVAGDAALITNENAASLPGEVWRPQPNGIPLRVAKAGTLDALMVKHRAFLNRLGRDGFKPVPPLAVFGVAHYRRSIDPAMRLVAAFELHKTIAEQADLAAGRSRFRPFHPVRKCAYVAGLVRHATAECARRLGWDEKRITSFVLGHGDAKAGQATTDDRLCFLPLPSITPLKVEAIRRVLVVAPSGADLGRLPQGMNGQELMDEGSRRAVATLAFIPRTDKFLGRYLNKASVWSTVTPVILPGYDDPDGLRRKLRQRAGQRTINAQEQRHLLDRLDRRAMDLLQSAFLQAGLSDELMRNAQFEYRSVGFLRGLDLARNYELPPLRYPRYHVRVRFPHPIAGPLAVGAGRYRGFGLFVSDD